MTPRGQDFAARLLAWYARHGRSHFAWQRSRTPYRVWVSEIMLQQTRTATVEGYFERFVDAFPDVATLARAPLDEVLHCWSGLGYYARARNLHRAAQLVVERHRGRMPETLGELTALPGIGRSTAGAILALAHHRRHPILDGNVKRVLARHAAIDGPVETSATLRELWTLAEARTPARRVADYTQAIMDLGATVCLARSPNCVACPVAADCRARIEDRTDALPAPRKRRARPQRATRMLLARDRRGCVLVVRRPASGIWGGLWAPPELDDGEDTAALCRRLGLRAQGAPQALDPIDHAFTHFDLRITPLLQPVQARAVMDGAERLWYNPEAPQRLGLAAPVTVLLTRLKEL